MSGLEPQINQSILCYTEQSNLQPTVLTLQNAYNSQRHLEFLWTLEL